MPTETLRSLADEAHKIGGKLVFRGLYKNSFKETAQKFKELKREAFIDPTLFLNLRVTKVPTFVILKDQSDTLTPLSIYDSLSGNISLKYALQKMAEEGEVAEASTLYKKLKGSLYA